MTDVIPSTTNVKGTIVPGTNMVGGTVIPGAVKTVFGCPQVMGLNIWMVSAIVLAVALAVVIYKKK